MRAKRRAKKLGNLVALIWTSVLLSSGLVHAQTAKVPVTAQADDETPSESGGEVLHALDRPGFDFAARFGFALPLGYLAGNAQISNGLSAIVPLELGVGRRANKNVAVGAAIDFAPAVTTNCASAFGCFAMDYRLGVEVIFTSRSVKPLNPWVGLGFGYEWLELSGADSNVELKGWDYVNVALGTEFRPGDQYGLGPFVGVSIGKYTSGSADGESGDVSNPAIHVWLQFGLRGVINS